uniref:Uncharacterized protein n=1 Tax=Glossina austeni TaxID=7395 RepID=A0A1A9V518_GLOAU
MTNAVKIFYWDKALLNKVIRKNSLESNVNESTNMLFFNPLENMLWPCGKKRDDKHIIEVKTQGEDWPILFVKSRISVQTISCIRNKPKKTANYVDHVPSLKCRLL